MNYFNYFTEIEETFIRRRGKHLLLSPMDWALIESWKEMGVPLHVALRGIEHAFDSFEARPRRRSVKTLLYCQEEVEAQFAEWKEGRVGAASDGSVSDETAGGNGAHAVSEVSDSSLPFPRSTILDHLSTTRETLRQLHDAPRRVGGESWRETLERVVRQLGELEDDFRQAKRPSAERLEQSLGALERLLNAALGGYFKPDELDDARRETTEQLRKYRSRMDAPAYEQTFENLLLKRLREQAGVPRLSLFYI